jgi:hypothetical protein
MNSGFLAINRSTEENLSREDMTARCTRIVYQQYHLAPRLQYGETYNRDFISLMLSWGLVNFASVLEEMRIFREYGHIGNVHFQGMLTEVELHTLNALHDRDNEDSDNDSTDSEGGFFDVPPVHLILCTQRIAPRQTDGDPPVVRRVFF